MDVKKGSFADKLNRLFEEKRKPDGTQYSQMEVVEGTKGTLTRVYLWKLRNNRALNPGYQIIQAIANFFGVDSSYFFANSEEEAKLINRAQGNTLVDQIAMRSAELDNDSKQAVLYMIDSILKSKEKDEDK
jgi:transcriptional regulator with XRE-family HTH domain